ncbi:amino acid permease 8-like [Telopea speciosissima]|uniref:amino acid permease 8-like n=1 Tax=Telopea speciosissima TaxID=54955 RepID=UPI001CC409BF|nr:amino acid permease 8-like [Telopea speciosissima]
MITEDFHNEVVSESGLDSQKASNGVEDLDDDGRPRRNGTLWTASAHILTSVIGSGVLAIPWTVRQLGWIAGPAALMIFSFITLYTSILLTDCYRFPDPVYGKRNYTYREAVRANLGRTMFLVCGIVQYITFVGLAVGFTITASKSMGAIYRTNCYHKRGHEAPCEISDNFFAISFGIIEIVLSQIPNFHKLSWLSSIAAVTPFIYTLVGVVLSLAKIVSGKTGKTSLKGVVDDMNLSDAQKVWRVFNALGDIAFAYSFSFILIEIQDTIKSPGENKLMKKATCIGVSTTTLFYMLCGCIGYAAFGNQAPGNMLTDFGFYEPFWLIDIANLCIMLHIVGAYQVFSQLLYAVFESWITKRCPKSKFITREFPISITSKCFSFNYNFNVFRLTCRTAFVVFATVMAMVIPFFNSILAFLGAIAYWPMTIYFPVEMYISQKKIRRFKFQWMVLQLINVGCLLVSLAAICGSIQSLIGALGADNIFKFKQ